MPETEAKYHHLIPQTYMTAWANESGTMDVEFLKAPGKIVKRNKEHIAGITDFHSIQAGMPLCTENDTNELFAAVTGYTVEYCGQVLSTTLDMNNHFYDFDKWIITRPDGTHVSKKSLRREIEKVKIRDIEVNWSIKYENMWGDEVRKIETIVLSATQDEIPCFDREYLMCFFTALDWRGFCSNQMFENTYQTLASMLEDVEIPEDERVLPSLKTASDEMRHYLLLQFYRKFLNDSGVIYQDAMANLANTNFHFLISDGHAQFCTCDTPAFIYERDDKKLMGLLPVSPRILLAKGKNSDHSENYYVSHITDETVNKYNNIIKKHATEFVIHPL